LRLTDAPFDDAVRVKVKFVEVRLRKKGGSDWVSIDLSSKAQPIDLLALQGTKTADLLRDVKVPRVDYDELRLIVDTASMANTIELSSGGIVELTSASPKPCRLRSWLMLTCVSRSKRTAPTTS
jgi:hypothetical protein